MNSIKGDISREAIDFWGYEFFEEEYKNPYQFGGWT